MKAFEPEILALDQKVDIIEGQTKEHRMVLLNFKSRDEATDWYKSEAYQSSVS